MPPKKTLQLVSKTPKKDRSQPAANAGSSTNSSNSPSNSRAPSASGRARAGSNAARSTSSDGGAGNTKHAVALKPRKPPKSDVDLKKEAIRSNPNGVRIFNTNLENSKAVMAGYLQLADTNALATLLSRAGELDNCS